MDETVAALGAEIRKARVLKGLSQETLGELAGLDRTYISGVERGVRNPTITSVKRIADALDENLSRLFKAIEIQ